MGVDFSKEAGRPPLSIACVAAISELDVDRFHAFRKAIQTVRSPTFQRRSSRVLLEINLLRAAATVDLDVEVQSGWRVYDLPLVNFERALEECEIAEHDRFILERIFIIMDRTGDEVVHALELLIAMALLVHGPFTTKLELAVSCLVEGLRDHPILPTHLVFLISTMTTVAHYFGDPLQPLPVLENIADDAFDELNCIADFDPQKTPTAAIVQVLVEALATHPFVQEYVSQD